MDNVAYTPDSRSQELVSRTENGRPGSSHSLDVATDSESKAGQTERGNWGGQLEFIFTCIGFAVGLGNVWRFPYLCYKNGGGAFLLPYILMLAFVGLPLFFMELALGQFASLGPITVWRINPLLKGLGYAMVSVSWLVAIYYNVVISHVMLYLFASFASIATGVPWESCDNYWNTADCRVQNGSTTADTGEILASTAVPLSRNISNITTKTPAEEYYYNYVLEMSDGMDEFGSVNWKLALCLLLSWLIVLVCLIKGIQSLGKVVYFTAIFPYVMLTILLIRGLTLPGASKGIIFYLKPDFERLKDARVWSDAATQIFYSLGCCSGGLIAMSSYNKFNNNCLRDSLIVALVNCGTSVYAGFVIFSILGFIAHEKGVDVKDVAAGGPGLAFVVYPEALSRMPVPQFWAICFFFMMATLGFGSQFSMMECVFSSLTDEFEVYLRGKWQSICFRSALILATFLVGLPMVCKGGYYLLNLVDFCLSGFPLLFIGLFECVALNWIYSAQFGSDRFLEDICLMLGKQPNIYWKACWKGVSPAIIFLTIVFNCVFYAPPTLEAYTYPPWAQALGWLTALFPLLLIPAFMAVAYCRSGGFQLLKALMRPTPNWGPSLEEHRTDFYAPRPLANQLHELNSLRLVLSADQLSTADATGATDISRNSISTSYLSIPKYKPNSEGVNGAEINSVLSLKDALWQLEQDRRIGRSPDGASDTDLSVADCRSRRNNNSIVVDTFV